ncbi:MAG: hypothetical protein NTV50_06005, partial [Planctomycetota bacterium]|nr:hypothetical protein [Planctomycetota bacterium]
MHKSNPIIPAIAVILGFTYFYFQAAQPSDPVEGFHIQEFARLPIVDRGRIKPMDTFARVSLMVMNDGFQTFKPEISKEYEQDKRQPAVRWLLDVMTSKFSENHIAEKHKVFRIENDQLLGLLALQPRPGLRYSIEEFAPQIGELEKAGKAADQKENAKKDAFDKSVLQLAHHLQSYMEIASLQTPLVIPAGKGEDWKPFMQAVRESRSANQADPNAGMNPTVSKFGEMLLSYLENKPPKFNKALAEYRDLITKELPVQSEISGFEVFFNHFAPFYHCIVVYLFVFLISCFAWV